MGVYQRPPRRRRCPVGSRQYTVRRDDTFYSIARDFNTTVAELRRLNPGINQNRLRPGQIICVPTTRPGDPGRPCPRN
jgi:LysM repeat protein